MGDQPERGGDGEGEEEEEREPTFDHLRLHESNVAWGERLLATAQRQIIPARIDQVEPFHLGVRARWPRGEVTPTARAVGSAGLGPFGAELREVTAVPARTASAKA